MTQEEIIKRNEAIDLMLKKYPIYETEYNVYWENLMSAYEYIKSLGFRFKISERETSTEALLYMGLSSYFVNDDPSTKTAIWLTVSDFAMDFNKKKDDKSR